MYNSIYPININYRKNQYRTNGDKNANAQKQPLNNQQENTQPQPQPQRQQQVSPYANGQINISQVLADFKNTILAINAPQEVQEEVNLYLGLVDRESKKEAPSKDIILTNLRNASKISDNYIATVLNKQSNVVEGWITTLFQQKINLKANPNEINPDFLLKFPQKAQEKIDNAKVDPSSVDTTPKESSAAQKEEQKEVQQETKQEVQQQAKQVVAFENDEKFEVKSSIELSQNSQPQLQTKQTEEIQIKEVKPQKTTPFSPLNETDKQARALLAQIKKLPKSASTDTQTLNMLNEALGILSQEENGNANIKAAIHLERGKIFDNYDYVDYALRDYVEATKADDLNLKAHAFYKLANVYDEFKEFPPALENYLSSVAYSGEAENLNAQARVLSKIASLYTKQFDLDETINYTDLAIETALDSQNNNTIAATYSQGAQNYQYLGENKRALENYKNALKAFSREDESYEQMAFNYEQAARAMEKLGNKAKAAKLQLKANQYYQRAQLQNLPQEAVS